MFEELLARLYGTKPDPENPLYHYTSLEGLRGIVDSRTLWATDIRYLNDAQELHHFGQLVIAEIDARMEREK